MAECMTRSAPSVRGCESAGVAAVLSTASRAPASCARSAMAGMSVTPQVGFAGDSTQISLWARHTRHERRAARAGGAAEGRAGGTLCWAGLPR